jgi:hypothetical protein
MDDRNKNRSINKGLETQIKELNEELEFYKSIFKTHGDSGVFNLRIKTIDGKKLWIDKVRERCNRELILSLDQDEETMEWLEHVRCER